MRTLFAVLVVGGYPWLAPDGPSERLDRRIAPPDGYERVATDGFGGWLRGLPLKPGRSNVLLFDGRPKRDQSAHFAVVDMDTGKRDLQQCADCVMRLRAEWLWSREDFGAIAFDFTSGDRAEWSRWAQGMRPIVDGNRVRWEKRAKPARDYATFRSYLETVFTYAGSLSLSRETAAVRDDDPVQAGDLFIRGGTPGHVVLVLDVAERDGRRVFLLGQGYTPAQDFHVLRNPNDGRLSPWYAADFGAELKTPEWTFRRGERRRFKG